MADDGVGGGVRDDGVGDDGVGGGVGDDGVGGGVRDDGVGGADWLDQAPYRIRFGWGPNGLRRLAPLASVLIIVDVLSFSTAVDVALGRGASLLPYRWHDGTEADYARRQGAVLAARRPAPGRLSLRPSSLVAVEAGTRLVLPSPNGSALAFAAEAAGSASVMVGCLRNASAVGAAAAAGRGDGVVGVIAAGERWRGTTGPLRPAIEDLIGAGAVVEAMAAKGGNDGLTVDDCSPEARVALVAFADARPELVDRLRSCGSGRELIDKGHGEDVDLAAALDASPVVPTLAGIELVDGRG